MLWSVVRLFIRFIRFLFFVKFRVSVFQKTRGMRGVALNCVGTKLTQHNDSADVNKVPMVFFVSSVQNNKWVSETQYASFYLNFVPYCQKKKENVFSTASNAKYKMLPACIDVASAAEIKRIKKRRRLFRRVVVKARKRGKKTPCGIRYC